MKTTGLFLLLLVMILAGCNTGTDKADVSSSDTLQVPQNRFLSEQQLKDQVDMEIKNALVLANDERILDAVEIINLTETAIRNILDSTYTEAVRNLEKAIGKATVLTAARPELSFFPLDVNVTVKDLAVDMDYLRQIRYEADKMTDKGYLQAARHLLKDLACEIEIKTPMLPVATYPAALSAAAKALEENRIDEALVELNTALGTIYIESRYIPLPLIRAERMLAEVSTQLENEDSQETISVLLENAEYQIRFAKALGYGKRDKEFEDLYSAIKEIHKEIKKEKRGNSANQVLKIREKLKLFKERISGAENNLPTDEAGE
jgi:hypothetical protein